MRHDRFAQRTRPPAIYRVLRLGTLALVAVWVPLAAWSGYRAIVQIFRLDVDVPERVAAGTLVRANVVTSGRTHADVSIALVQGAQVRPVASRFIRGNSDGALDPRPRRDSLVVALTTEQLAGWGPGPLVLRATAVGRSQWLRLPPPTVREVTVMP